MRRMEDLVQEILPGEHVNILISDAVDSALYGGRLMWTPKTMD